MSKLITQGIWVLAAMLVVAGCAAPRGWHVREGTVRRGGYVFFPLEIYSLKIDSDFRVARHLGFNATIDDGPLAFELSGRYGLALTLPNWFDSDTTEELVRAKVRSYRDEDALFAWNLADEPDLRRKRSPPDLLAGFAQVVREEDAARLISVTLSGARGARRHWKDYASGVDILRIDPYPVAEGVSFEDARARLRLARSLAGPSRAVWMILQAWQGSGARLPTADELRLGAYIAFLEGAGGLSVFDFNLDTWMDEPAFFEELLRTLCEARLLRHLELTFPSREVRTSNESVSARAWSRSGGTGATLIAVANLAGVSTEARIEMPPGRVERLRGTAPPGDRDGALSLAAHEVMLLKVTGGDSSRAHQAAVLDAGEGEDVYDLDAAFLFALGNRSRKRIFYRNASEMPRPARILKSGYAFYVVDLHGERWRRLGRDGPETILLPAHSTVEAVGEKEFVADGFSVSLSSGAAMHPQFSDTLHRYFVCAGESIELVCAVDGPSEARLEAQLFDYSRALDNAVEVTPFDDGREGFIIRIIRISEIKCRSDPIEITK